MVSKNKINQVSKEFKKMENKYLMGIIYNTFLKDIRLDIVVSDALTEGDIVVFDYTNDVKTIKSISNIVENAIKNI